MLSGEGHRWRGGDGQEASDGLDGRVSGFQAQTSWAKPKRGALRGQRGALLREADNEL